MPAPPSAGRRPGPQGFAALAMCLAPALVLLGPGPAPPRLLPAAPPPCAVPVLSPGRGLRCLPGPALRLQPGDVALPARAHGPPARMAPGRLLAAAVPVDVNHGDDAELEALPGVGPGLARRIVAARPLRGPGDLAAVVGARRAAEVLPLLRFR